MNGGWEGEESGWQGTDGINSKLGYAKCYCICLQHEYFLIQQCAQLSPNTLFDGGNNNMVLTAFPAALPLLHLTRQSLSDAWRDMPTNEGGKGS